MKTYLLGQPDNLAAWYKYIWQPEDVPSVPLTEPESTIVEPCLMCGEKVSAVWGRKDAVCERCGLKKECC